MGLFGKVLVAVLGCMFAATAVHARTVVLDGKLDGEIAVTQEMTFSVPRPISAMSFRFALPATSSNRLLSQEVSGIDSAITPRPASVRDERDAFGNTFRTATWGSLAEDVRIALTFTVRTKAELSAVESSAPFPLGAAADPEKRYLASTKQVQSEHDEIRTLSRRLTAGARNEYEAVTAVMNHVIDNVTYTLSPPQYDALYTMRTKSGNCQNYAHLAIALLRAAGIPARIVGGISLSEPWKAPLDESNSIVQSMGQGGHAWMEVWFPDLGWLAYDPQQSRQFTSTRHIKQTHGLDSTDVNDSWRAAPYVPKYAEQYDARFTRDIVSVRTRSTASEPRAYFFASAVVAKAAVAEPSVPVIVPPPPLPVMPPPPPKPLLPPGKRFQFGNTQFPSLADVYRVTGDRGEKTYEKETAEYVTSDTLYAQAFEIDETVSINEIALAMHKFGGDGTLFLDIVSDENGRPSLTGVRTQPVFLDSFERKPGYYWVTFNLSPDDRTFAKGRYWMVLRKSGAAVMNWFYIPGNPFGDADDTRSTMKGLDWRDIQNYDLVFKISAERR